jgi:hypothetical protein
MPTPETPPLRHNLSSSSLSNAFKQGNVVKSEHQFSSLKHVRSRSVVDDNTFGLEVRRRSFRMGEEEDEVCEYCGGQARMGMKREKTKEEEEREREMDERRGERKVSDTRTKRGCTEGFVI